MLQVFERSCLRYTDNTSRPTSHSGTTQQIITSQIHLKRHISYLLNGFKTEHIYYLLNGFKTEHIYYLLKGFKTKHIYFLSHGLKTDDKLPLTLI